MVAFYIMLARPVGRFFTVRQMNFPVMLIAKDICGRWLGLCRYADIGIGLAPLVCARICSTRTTDTGARVWVSTSTRIRSHCPRGRLQMQVGVPQDLRWQIEVLTIWADKSLNK